MAPFYSSVLRDGVVRTIYPAFTCALVWWVAGGWRCSRTRSAGGLALPPGATSAAAPCLEGHPQRMDDHSGLADWVFCESSGASRIGIMAFRCADGMSVHKLQAKWCPFSVDPCTRSRACNHHREGSVRNTGGPAPEQRGRMGRRRE